MPSSHLLQRSYQRFYLLFRAYAALSLWTAFSNCGHYKIARSPKSIDQDFSRPITPLLRNQQLPFGKTITWHMQTAFPSMQRAPIWEGLDCNQDGRHDLFWWKCLQTTQAETSWYYCRKELDMLQNGRIQLAYTYDSTGKVLAVEKDVDGDGFVDSVPSSYPALLPSMLDPHMLPQPAFDKTDVTASQPEWGCRPL